MVGSDREASVVCTHGELSSNTNLKKKKERSHDDYMIQVDVLRFPDMNLNNL